MKVNLIRLFRSMLDQLYSMNPKLIHRLTDELNLTQGKGFGDRTTHLEATITVELLSQIVLQPIIFDIGANMGSYTSSILDQNPNATVYAFEPSKVAVESLKNRFQANPSVIVIPHALGGQNGTGTLWSDFEGSGLGSLRKRRLEHFDITFSKAEKVQIVTIDSWCEKNAVYPHMIKIDVEGSEFDVLSGGIQTLQQTRLVQFEFGGSNIDSRTFFQDFWYFFTELNFNLFRISRTGLVPIFRYSEDEEFFKTTNYLALKNV